MSDYLDKFLTAYIVAALWSTTDESDPETGGEPMDASYDVTDIAPETHARMRQDCELFIMRASYLMGEWTPEQAGHDFWLTREGHGTGFWDRGKKHGDALTQLAKQCGAFHLYVGDDGTIHGS